MQRGGGRYQAAGDSICAALTVACVCSPRIQPNSADFACTVAEVEEEEEEGPQTSVGRVIRA